MINKTTHTPGPWKVEERRHGQLAIYAGSYTIALIETLDDSQAKANVYFIVRAVNAYEELLAACKRAVKAATEGRA